MNTIASTKLAYHKSSTKVIHIKSADRGQACGCICLECSENLEAAQGNIRDWYFRHVVNVDCRGGQETALHELGKQILIENSQIKLPKQGIINYSDPASEKTFISTRPDVTAIYNGQKIYFEIAVKHFVEDDKKDFFNNGQCKCVEIDLSNVDTSSYEIIKEAVLNETSNKKLYGWENIEKPAEIDWFSIAMIGSLFALIFGLFRKTRKSRKNYF